MGIDKYMRLKADGNLDNLLDLHNYGDVLEKITQKEKDLILQFRRFDLTEEVVNKFYLYYDFIKQNDSNKINMLLTNSKDKWEYINNITNDRNSGYKWVQNMLMIPAVLEMIAIEEMDTELILDIREKSNIPINIIISAMLELDLIKEKIERNDVF